MSQSFQSTLPTRGSDYIAGQARGYFVDHFNPRSPRGGATVCMCRKCRRCPRHFNPRSPRGGATMLSSGDYTMAGGYFNPRSPRGGATVSEMSLLGIRNDFNPRSPRGGATVYANVPHFALSISIHAPHEGERPLGMGEITGGKKISIHAPHEGERLWWRSSPSSDPLNFNPRSPRGGATHIAFNAAHVVGISIHAPHEGERRFSVAAPCHKNYFNPRSPRGGATQKS